MKPSALRGGGLEKSPRGKGVENVHPRHADDRLSPNSVAPNRGEGDGGKSRKRGGKKKYPKRDEENSRKTTIPKWIYQKNYVAHQAAGKRVGGLIGVLAKGYTRSSARG